MGTSVVVIALAILSQTRVMRALVVPAIESAIGCQAACSSARVSLGGVILVRDLVLRVPGVSGPEGVFLESPKVSIGVSWLGMIFGGSGGSGGAVRDLTLINPIVRLSIGPDQSLNVSPLARGGGGGVGAAVPNIDIVSGTLELGEHAPGAYHVLDSVMLAGSLSQKRAGSSLYTLAMTEIKGANPGDAIDLNTALKGVRITGQVDVAQLSGKLTLQNVDLAEWGRKTAPTPVRDLWRTMAISGSIREAELGYDRKNGPSAGFTLDGVTMNIPVPARVNEDDATPAGLLAMRGVSGTIRFDAGGGLSADLAGSIEEMPCQVVLKTSSLDLNSALDCKIIANKFKLVDRPDILPLAPKIARRLIQRFSSPTAEVLARVQVTRAEPTADGPSPVKISGLIEFEKGRAEFERFSYPITDLAGTVTFDDNAVEIVRVVGSGPTTARLLASGRIWPPTDDAAVDIVVTVVDIPLDELFERSLPEHRRDIFGVIFDRAAHARLIEQGLIAPPGAEAGPMSMPAFELGGVAEMAVRVTREEGPNHEYLTDITLRSPEVGVLVKRLPYPCLARDVSIRITDQTAAFECATVEGLSGATGSVKGTVNYTAADYAPDIAITGRDVPIDPLLIFALERPSENASAEPAPDSARLSAAELIRRLRLAGRADADAVVRHSGAGVGEIGYTVDVRAQGLSAEPGSIIRADGIIEGGMPLTGISGSMTLTERGATLHAVRGTIGGGAAGATGSFEIEASALSTTPTDPPTIDAAVRFDDLDLGLPIERLVGAVAPTQGPALRAVRESYNPSGVVDGSVTVQGAGDAIDFRARVNDPRHLAFTAFGGRITLDNPTGSAEITRREAVLNAVRSAVAFDGGTVGTLELDGSVALADATASELRAKLEGCRFESPMVRAIARSFDSRAADVLDAANASGVFDAGATLRRFADRAPEMDSWIEPRQLTLTRRAETMRFDQVTGRIAIGPQRGRVEQLRASAADWGFTLDGEFQRGSFPSANLAFTLEGRGLPKDFRAAMPERVDDVLNTIELMIGGGFGLRDGQLLINDSALGPAFTFTGEAWLEDAKLNAAVPIEQLTARAGLRVEQRAGESEPRVEVSMLADRLDVLGLTLTNGRAKLGSGDAAGLYVFPLINASAHGGVISARGRILTASSPDVPASYDFQLDFNGVRLAPMLADLANAPEGDAETPLADDRGEIDGTLSFAGLAGRPESRRGRGTLRVSGGEVVKLPWILPLIELSNLQPPVGERLGFASAELFLEGDRAVFERIELLSDSLAIVGEGETRLSDSSLDLWFRTKSGTRIPILTDILESVRDELVTTRVTGTLKDPKFGAESLTGTRKMLGSFIRGEERPKDAATPQE